MMFLGFAVLQGEVDVQAVSVERTRILSDKVITNKKTGHASRFLFGAPATATCTAVLGRRPALLFP
jgi:hypothetical protein